MALKPAPKSKRLSKCRKTKSSWSKQTTPKKRRQKDGILVANLGNAVVAARYFIPKIAILSVLIICSFVFLTGYGLYKELNSSFASADSLNSYDIHNDDLIVLSIITVDEVDSMPFNLEEIKLLVLDTNSHKYFVVDVPVHAEIDAPGKFGEESIAKILNLGALINDDPEKGIVMLNDGLKKTFGINVDKYIFVKGTSKDYLYRLLMSGNPLILKDVDDLQSLKNDIKTNLSLSEFYSLYKMVNKKDEETSGAISNNLEKLEQDEVSEFDAFFREVNFDSAVAKERLSVAILNGTNVPGLASFGSRIVENLGARIIAVSNSDITHDTSIIISDDPNSATVYELSRFFDIQNVISKKEAAYLYDEEIQRSDVILILGFDTAKSL